MITNNPATHQPASTSDQWAAILRYDASRKTSNSTNDAVATTTKTRRFSDQASVPATIKQPKRLSLGDDLLHMPYLSTPSLAPLNHPRSSFGSNTICPSSDYEKAYPLEIDDTARRPSTPPALKGDHAILVDRELDRLRRRHVKATQRHWRIYTGTVMLVVMGLYAFVFAKYVLAFLALSPATWILSDAADGTHASPDPLLRILTLVAACASGIALLGTVSSGFYLRFSRQRSCGTLFVWILAITSTTIGILLCVVNLALIAIWHQKYTSSSSRYAATRDVSRRCSGSWALDVLWQAAESSSTSNIDTEHLSSCPHNAKGTLQHYLIAGGIRLAVVVAFCTLWLICLARYNCSLQLVDVSTEEVEESAEMHRLLMEVEAVKQSSETVQQEARNVPGSYREEYDESDLGRQPEGHAAVVALAPPPKLDRFRWQRASSTAEEVQSSDNVPEYHEKESSAGAWSIGVVGQVWGALWGTNDTLGRHQVAQDDEEDQRMHDRQATKLGVRSWFRTDGSETLSEGHGRAVEYSHCSDPVHLRTPSQEKRAKEGRHAAARLAKIREEEGIADARGREERRRVDQQQRLAFLASLANDGMREEQKGGDHPSRPSSQSAGDDLPHMPEMTMHTRTDPEGEDDGIYWQPLHDFEAGKSREKAPPTHLYVRTMGKLIRTLSAIESEGSQERADRRGVSGPSGSELY